MASMAMIMIILVIVFCLGVPLVILSSFLLCHLTEKFSEFREAKNEDDYTDSHVRESVGITSLPVTIRSITSYPGSHETPIDILNDDADDRPLTPTLVSPATRPINPTQLYRSPTHDSFSDDDHGDDRPLTPRIVSPPRPIYPVHLYRSPFPDFFSDYNDDDHADDRPLTPRIVSPTTPINPTQLYRSPINDFFSDYNDDDDDDDTPVLRPAVVTSGGLDQAMIDSFPAGCVGEKMVEGDPGLQCVICLMEYSADDVIRRMPCFHVFHVKCIDQWLRTNDVCPLCKKRFHDLIRHHGDEMV